LSQHHDRATQAWLRIAKKGSGVVTVTVTDALDVALCYGWIDGQRRGQDASFFLQRYTRRRPRSTWSQVNVARVAALEAAGRLQPPGVAQIEAAKADGRWTTAYEAQRTASVPADLAAALEANPVALAAFQRLGRSDRYAVMLPLLKARTVETRSRLLARVVDRLIAEP
jgi:uncharacterized protein YdeI (YjbR/CyaY-like superfamily)